MKKNISLLLLLLVALVFTASYFFIPARKIGTYTTMINCTQTGAMRTMLNKEKNNQWLPDQKKYNYHLDKMTLNGFEATVFYDKDSVKGDWKLLPANKDSSLFICTYTYRFSANPLKRLIQYAGSSSIKNDIENFTTGIKKYFDRDENIYGMKITKQPVTDSSHIAILFKSSHYPTMQELYDTINCLKDYVRKENGQEKNYPIFHTEQEGTNLYQTIVAIPTKWDLPAKGRFRLKKMALGVALVTEVKGGLYAVLKAEEEIRNYMYDYHKAAPVVSFQSLITNRQMETDSSKWITSLHFPVYDY